MVQGGMSCVKYLMFIFNFVFVICGIGLIVVGAIVHHEDFTKFMNSEYVTAPNILIAAGVFIFILSSLGCCGAIRENHCMVMTFGILLFLVFVLEIAGGISAYVKRHELEDILQENMNSSIHQNKKDAKDMWDEMQMRLHCCGVKNYTDWTGDLPKSCCPQDGQETCTSANVYTIGCYDKLLQNLNKSISKIGGVAIGLAVVELIGMAFSWCLASAIKKEYEGV